MKSGDKMKTNILRTLLAKLKDREINTRKELSNKEGFNVIKTLVKQLKESSVIFRQAGRHELAEKEELESDILKAYLPQMMADDDIKLLVKNIINETGATNLSDIGKVMPLVMKRGAGKVDGKIAKSILTELLE